MDSVVVAPGGVGLLTTTASVAGNYVYRATTPTGTSKAWKLAGLLGGALVIDSAGMAPPRDRVLVGMQAMDSAYTAYVDSTNGDLKHAPAGIARILYTINGRSWPNTERIAATVGDSLHWRVINATFDVHPMHLHGFYFRVDAFSGPLAPAPGAMVVTQLMTPFRRCRCRGHLTGQATGFSIVISRCISTRILFRPPRMIRTSVTWWAWCSASTSRIAQACAQRFSRRLCDISVFSPSPTAFTRASAALRSARRARPLFISLRPTPYRRCTSCWRSTGTVSKRGATSAPRSI
jgi:Multicopper oxidase